MRSHLVARRTPKIGLRVAWGGDVNCQPNLALSAKSCASFRLLRWQPSDFPASASAAARYADCRLRIRAPDFDRRRDAPGL